jgi:hypothetical protein
MAVCISNRHQQRASGAWSRQLVVAVEGVSVVGNRLTVRLNLILVDPFEFEFETKK